MYRDNEGTTTEPTRAPETPILERAMKSLQESYEAARMAEDDAERNMHISRNVYEDCNFQRTRIEQALNEMRGLDNINKADTVTYDEPRRH